MSVAVRDLAPEPHDFGKAMDGFAPSVTGAGDRFALTAVEAKAPLACGRGGFLNTEWRGAPHGLRRA